MKNRRKKIPELEKMVQTGRKKFVRYEEGAMLYSMGLHSFQNLAKDAGAVKKKFLMLTYSHIEYVLHCMSGNTTKVKNIKKYLLAALFNAPSTMNGYYQAEVNHDMPGLAR